MFILRIKALLSWPLLLMFFIANCCKLNAQVDQFELAAADRLYDFEMARLQQDFDKMIALTYPGIFHIIDKSSLRQQMALLANSPPKSPNRLHNFKLQTLGDPLETNDHIYLRVEISYDNWSSSSTREKIQRKVLAIRSNNDLDWYFLETGIGRNDLLSSILPTSLLR